MIPRPRQILHGSLFAAMLVLLGCATRGLPDLAAEPVDGPRGKVNVAEDEAAAGPYGDAWATGDNGGGGFTPWEIRVSGDDEPRGHAGVFVARPGRTGAPVHVLRDGAAFGLYANGSGDESVVVGRGLQAPMAVGDSFSVLLEAFHPGAADPGGDARLVVALRSGRGLDAPVVVAVEWDRRARAWLPEGAPAPTSVPERDEAGAVVLSLTRLGATAWRFEVHRTDGSALRRVERLEAPAQPVLGFSVAVANNPGDVFLSGLQVNRALEAMPTGRR